MTLLEFITDKETGKVRHGAWSRVSEYTGLSIASLKRYVVDPTTVSLQSIQKIQDCIHARISLEPLKAGRKFLSEKTEPTDDLCASLTVAAKLAKTERKLREQLKDLQSKLAKSTL